MIEEQGFKFLAVRNWKKYQAGVDRKGRQIKAWVKDYAGKDVNDQQYSKMTMNQRYLFDAICRLRARVGRNINNDPTWVALALGVTPNERARVPNGIRTLVERGFLALTNEEVDASEPETEPETQPETETQVPPPVASASPLPSGEQVKTSCGSGSLANQDQRQPQHRKPCACSDGLCDWSDPIPGCANPAHVGDCVYYQRHVKKNDYFIPRLTNAYVRKEWKRLAADTPEDYCYDPDPLFETTEKHLDGIDNPPTHQTMLRRAPRTAKERQQVRAKFPHLPGDVVRKLYHPSCKHGCKEGTIEVSDYPGDPLLERLKHAENCPCVMEDRDE